MPIQPDALAAIQKTLGHTFANPDLLVQALTHKTRIEEQWPGGQAEAHRHESQERLEFLGDAFLGWIVGRWCYEGAPVADPGGLTRMRKAFTQGAWLQQRGAQMGFEPVIRRGTGEAQNAKLNHKIVEDTLEALIGAVLVDPDGGPAVAQQIILGWLPDEVPADAAGTHETDPIIAFQEWHTKTYRRTAPKLTAERTGGTDHLPLFTCQIDVGGRTAHGSGSNKQEAQRAACQDFLDRLNGA